DRAGAEIDLEGGDTEGRALGRADFGREVGEGRKVVPGERGRQRELTAGELHAVAAIAGEADDDRLGRGMRRGFLIGYEMRGCGHGDYLAARAARVMLNLAGAPSAGRRPNAPPACR